MADLKFHEAANIFPLLDGDEFDALVEDIRKNGQLVPISTFDGKVIDGRNRYRACLLAKCEPNITDATEKVESMGGPAAFVLSMDNRRHMEKGQRAMCAARLMDYEREEAKKRLSEGAKKRASLPRAEGGRFAADSQGMPRKDDPGGTARARAGKRFGVGHTIVDQAEKVLKKAVPEVVKAVDSGKLTVPAAVKIAELPPEEQPAAIAKAPKRGKKKGKPAAPSFWSKARSHLQKCHDEIQFASAKLTLGATSQFRDALNAVARLTECIDALERKGRNHKETA